MLTRLASMLCVVVVWAITPVLKRQVIDYMSLADDLDGPSPVRTFVMINSIVCTAMAGVLAYPPGPRQLIERIPAQGWFVLIVGAALATFAGILIVKLISTGNPGETMVYLNAGTNILSYVIGALLYGNITWQATAGVLLITAGGTLVSN